MKTCFSSLMAALMLFCAHNLKAQTADTSSFLNQPTYQQLFDSLSSGLIKARVPYGVLFDRVLHWYEPANSQNGDTIGIYSLYQAWWDMEHSQLSGADSGSYAAMRKATDSLLLKRRFPVLSIDFHYGQLDTNALNDGRLSLVDSILTDNNLAQIPYDTGRLNIAGLITPEQVYAGDTFYMMFDPSLYRFSNTSDSLISVTITDLTEGFTRTILPGQEYPIVFHASGTHAIEITADAYGDAPRTVTHLLNVITPILRTTGADCEIEHHILESDIPFQGYDEPYATTTWGDYHIYYHFKPGTTDCERILKKPIIIMDGYDPLRRTLVRLQAARSFLVIFCISALTV